MRKTLMTVIALLVFVLSLSACSADTVHQSTDLKLEKRAKSPSVIINKNQKKWSKNTSHIPVIRSDAQHFDDRGHVAQSMYQLKNVNKAVIKGTIYNLEQMNSPEDLAFTKATVHIDQVISGDESLKNKTVYLTLNGGITSSDHKGSNHEMFVKYDEFPLPKIGSQIIVGLLPTQLDEPTEYNQAVKQSGFNNKNFYIVNMPQFNFWVKGENDDKYHLNNPKVKKSLISDLDMRAAIVQLTKEINQKYNK